MRDFFVITMITKMRPWRHIYHNIKITRAKNHDIKIPRPKKHDIEIPRSKNHDIEIPRPKNHDIEIPRPKNHDIEKRRQLTHDIVIPRRFFRGQKAMTSRFQDQKPRNRDSKTKKPRYGVPVEFWPLMPPDTSQSCRYFQVDSQKNAWILGSETWKYSGCDHKCDFGKACTTNSLQNINRRIAEYLFFQLFIY